MNFKRLTNILFIGSVILAVFGLGIKIGENKQIKKQTFQMPKNGQQNKNSDDFDFSLFWQTLETLEEKYVDKKKLDNKKLYYGAIKGMVSAVDDPYTFFLTPDENKSYKDDLDGKFSGIGAQLGLKNNQIVVIAPLKYTPAEKAGIKAGDFIIKVDDKSTEKWTLVEAVARIRGQRGTKVKLTLRRVDREFDVDITRDDIKVSSVELTFEKNIAVLKLIKFGDNTMTEWDNAVSQIIAKKNSGALQGIVLDLRDNPGGYLNMAVYVTSEFTSYGSLVVKQEFTDGTHEDYKSSREPRLPDIKLVVLMNKGSASASEIVAGALRDYNRAKLIGEKTFGKGSIQEAVDLKEGAGIHVTIAKWILPKGTWINGLGVKPDIEIQNKIDDKNTLSRKDDLQLDRAISEVIK